MAKPARKGSARLNGGRGIKKKTKVAKTVKPAPRGRGRPAKASPPVNNIIEPINLKSSETTLDKPFRRGKEPKRAFPTAAKSETSRTSSKAPGEALEVQHNVIESPIEGSQRFTLDFSSVEELKQKLKAAQHNLTERLEAIEELANFACKAAEDNEHAFKSINTRLDRIDDGLKTLTQSVQSTADGVQKALSSLHQLLVGRSESMENESPTRLSTKIKKGRQSAGKERTSPTSPRRANGPVKPMGKRGRRSLAEASSATRKSEHPNLYSADKKEETDTVEESALRFDTSVKGRVAAAEVHVEKSFDDLQANNGPSATRGKTEGKPSSKAESRAALQPSMPFTPKEKVIEQRKADELHKAVQSIESQVPKATVSDSGPLLRKEDLLSAAEPIPVPRVLAAPVHTQITSESPTTVEEQLKAKMDDKKESELVDQQRSLFGQPYAYSRFPSLTSQPRIETHPQTLFNKPAEKRDFF